MTPDPLDAVDERILPASPEAERAILGSILLDNRAYERPLRHLPLTIFRLTRIAESIARCVGWQRSISRLIT